jgi:hypothetical protein
MVDMLGTVNESMPYSKEWFYCFSSILEVSEVGHMYGGWARQPKRSLAFVGSVFFLRGLSGIPFLLDKALPG